jgi:hypothetical protein
MRRLSMLRSAVTKVMWVGRATVFVVGLAVILALVFGVASTALGANGDAWILGQNNAATAITRLAGAAGVDGPMLQLINNNPDADDTALALNVQEGEAPMRVNSDTRVTNLNSDKLDDLDAFQLMPSSTYTRTVDVTGTANITKFGTAFCDPGDKVLSGGFGGAVGGDGGDVDSAATFIRRSVPANTGQGWTVVYQSGKTADDIKVWALCADQ